MVAYTTTYSFAKPTVGDDEDVWGGYLNGNFDTLESLLKGTTALTAINVTGNITVGGNVDGRDIAADGSKLDGIESGATADQTKADIDALGIDAATLDSLDSTQFLRSDADDSTSGKITSTTSSSDFLEYNGSATNPYFRFKTSGTNNGYIQFSTTTAYFWNDRQSRGFRVDGTNNPAFYDSTAYRTIWHAGNDGSGSGLDADTTDGYQASEGSTGSTLAARNSNGDLYMRYGFSSYLNMSHSSTTRSSDTVFYSSTDNYLRKNNATGFKTSLGLNSTDSPSFAGLNINGNLNAVDNIYLATALFHEGDTDTRIQFGTNTITLQTGGSSEITVDTTGVRLGDTGNGYFQPVSGNYGSIQIDGGAHTGWEGYSIGGRAVFMHDNGTQTGIYNDVDNEWLFYAAHNAGANLYYNGLTRFGTTSTGVNIEGDLNAVDNIYVGGSLIHEGDTDTFINFADNVIYIRAGNSNNFACATGYTNVDKPLYNYAVYYEDFDGLTGTSVTVNCDTAQAFSLTMTGNTTFTFNSVSSGWSIGFVLELTGNGGTVTWPTSVEWAGGTAPDAPASGETDIYVFWTRDGGTTWYGVLSVDAAA